MTNQKTIKQQICIYGREWFTSAEVWIKCYPSDQGITVQYGGIIEKLTTDIIDRDENQYTVSIKIGGYKIKMVEHFFSALHGLGIDNIHIEFGSEGVPFCASAELFINAITSCGVVEISKQKQYLVVDKQLEISDGEKKCIIKPSDFFTVDSSISFNNIIGDQSFIFNESTQSYIDEISNARSFLIFPIETTGDPWKNYNKQFNIFPKTFPNDPKLCPFISYSRSEYITPLKYPNEPARHKILDFMGDLFILGTPIQASFEICKTGHSFHRKIIDKLRSDYLF